MTSKSAPSKSGSQSSVNGIRSAFLDHFEKARKILQLVEGSK